MISTADLIEALHRRGIFCEGKSVQTLNRWHGVEAPQLENVGRGTLALLLCCYGDDWQRCQSDCMAILRQGGVPLVRGMGPEGSLCLKKDQPLGSVLEILQDQFALLPTAALFRQLRQNGSEKAVIDLLGGELLHAAFVDEGGQPVAVSPDSGTFAEQIRLLPLHELLGIYQHRTIEVEGRLVGCLFYYVEQGEEPPYLVDEAAAVLSALMEQRIGSSSNLQRRREEQMRRLLFLSEEERSALGKSAFAGLPEGLAAAVVLRPVSELSDSLREQVRKQVMSFFPEAPSTWLEGLLIMMLSRETDSRIRLKQLMETPRLKGWTAGAGRFREIRFFAESLEEARRALKMGSSASARQVVFWEDCDLQSLLLPLAHGAEAACFIESHLGPLLAEPELLDTLDALERSGWRQAEAAKVLLVHYNTLRYRLNRIQALGVDIEGAGRQALSTAIMLLKLKGGLSSPAGTEAVRGASRKDS